MFQAISGDEAMPAGVQARSVLPEMRKTLQNDDCVGGCKETKMHQNTLVE